MKTTYIILIALLSVFAFSCSKNQTCRNSQVVEANTVDKNIQLADFLYKSGNLITNKDCPFLVHPADIFYYKNDFLIIDIRDTSEYEKGHIDGAYNVQRKDLMTFLKDSVNTTAYKKIAIVDESGPVAEYVAMLLHLDGYNSYGLKFGMGAWNRTFVSYISKYLSNKYAAKTESTINNKPDHGKIPDISSKNIMALLDQRVAELIAEPQDKFIVPADDYFNNMKDYFTIAYWSKEKYNKAHVIGSIDYATRSDLSFDKDLNTLPIDKKILVYCNTGHHAIAVVAYLRLLGYDACSIMYGVNSFMNGKFDTMAPGSAILDASVLCGDFPLLTGKDRTAKGDAVVVASSKNTPAPVVPIVRKKTTGNVGGCE